MTKYRTHVGRELELMLSGEKPLAMFYADADSEPDERIIPEERFNRYVEKGDIVREESTLEYSRDPRTDRPIRVRYVFYAVASEKWRINAMRLILEIMAEMGGADEGLDRLMSTLLGHSFDEVNDLVRKSRSRYRSFAAKHYG
jgi:hypothetical protein